MSELQLHLMANVAVGFALLVPFFIVLRWYGLGFVCSVLLGWGVIHWVNLNVPPSPGGDPLTDAAFKVVWLVFGPLYMTIWCSVVASLVWVGAEVIARIKGRKHQRYCID